MILALYRNRSPAWWRKWRHAQWHALREWAAHPFGIWLYGKHLTVCSECGPVCPLCEPFGSHRFTHDTDKWLYEFSVRFGIAIGRPADCALATAREQLATRRAARAV